MQNFEQDSLRDDLSLNGGGWNVDTVEFQSGASCEGFATYVAMASWHNPQNTTGTVEAFGFNLEQSVPLKTACTDNSGTAGQVAKTFWDLDDAQNETSSSPGTGNDGLNWATSTIVSSMDAFADGTSNRKDRESDADGVNVKDFGVNAGIAASAFYTHNDLSCQDDN